MTDLSDHKWRRGPIRTPAYHWRSLSAARRGDVIETMLVDAKGLREAGHPTIADAWEKAAELLRAMGGADR